MPEEHPAMGSAGDSSPTGSHESRMKLHQQLGARRCTNVHCDSPADSSHFYQIEEGKTAGGRDWSSLAGSVLCQACYDRFRNRGTLERAQIQNKPLVGSARRCTYEHCYSPADSSKFHHIDEGKAAGGQDWSSLVGSVLCNACHDRFRRRGTLERDPNRSLTGSARRCTYEHCDRPTDSIKFYSHFVQIEEGKTTGGQDWSSLAGSVLCRECYERFRIRGTLERAQIQNKPLVGSARRCTYEHCDNPADSSKFYQIEEGKTAGGQDWSSLVGSVLCRACYKRFYNRGTLERAANMPRVGSARRCTYEHCDNPADSVHFFQIDEGKTAGGRDWSSLVGSVLCKACYMRFRDRGTLERVRDRSQNATRPCTYSDSSQQLALAHSVNVAKRQKTSEHQDHEPCTRALSTISANACMVDFWDDDDEDGFERALLGRCRVQSRTAKSTRELSDA